VCFSHKPTPVCMGGQGSVAASAGAEKELRA
jgi:hypothetical protein